MVVDSSDPTGSKQFLDHYDPPSQSNEPQHSSLQGQAKKCANGMPPLGKSLGFVLAISLQWNQ